MNKEALNYIAEKTRELIVAPTCSNETKEAAQAWLNAIGTESEMAETKKYIAELEEDIMPIDNLIRFAGSDNGKAYFGEENAKNIESHAKEIKANGAKYCDCPACLVVSQILEKKSELFNEK